MADAAVVASGGGAAAGAAAPFFAVRDLNTWYGESHVLHGVTFDINPGEV